MHPVDERPKLKARLTASLNITALSLLLANCIGHLNIHWQWSTEAHLVFSQFCLFDATLQFLYQCLIRFFFFSIFLHYLDLQFTLNFSSLSVLKECWIWIRFPLYLTQTDFPVRFPCTLLCLSIWNPAWLRIDFSYSRSHNTSNIFLLLRSFFKDVYWRHSTLVWQSFGIRTCIS